MTLHISAIVAGAAYQVSDRLASVGRQPWDRTWNKTIVLRTMDALVTVGLTGPAFVGKQPIDEWVAEILFDSAIPTGTLITGRMGGPLRLGLSGSLRRLERSLYGAVKSGLLPRGASVGATVVGWRIQGRGMRVCAFALEWDADGQPHFRRRTRRKHRFARVGANPAGWVQASRLKALTKDITLAGSDVEREDLMIQVLREVAAAGHPVGPERCVSGLVPDSPSHESVSLPPPSSKQHLPTRNKP